MTRPAAAPTTASPVPTGRDAPRYLQGVAFVLAAGTLWSLGGVLVRWIEAATAWQIVFYRSLALVPLLLVVIAARHGGRIAPAFARAGWNGAAAGACLAGAFTAFIFALHHTTVANALFMLGGAPFLAALLGRWALGEEVRRATWVAMALACLGVIVMVANGLAIGTATGNLLAFATSAGFAAFSVLLRRGGREADMMPCVAYAGLIAAAIAAAAIALGGPGADPPSPGRPEGAAAGFALGLRDLALCATMGVVQLGMGLVAYTLGARHVPAAELTLLSMVELVLGPVWVWLGVGEVPSRFTLVGGGIVLAAIAYQALSGARRRRPPVVLV